MDSRRSYDTVARAGGDEFAFLLPGIGEKTCAPITGTICETVRKACLELKIDVDVSASTGAAFYPVDGDTAEDLLRMADRRMYSHKRKHYEELAAKVDSAFKLAGTA
jgi:diguanylate cyclase (GGDEF)-like protein